MSEEITKTLKSTADKAVKSESKKLYPVSDSDLKAMANKSEDDSNSYSKINKSIISKMKSMADKVVKDDSKNLVPVSDRDIKKIKGE